MIWFLLWLMINKFLNCSVTMINQLFNKFNNLFVFDPNKKSRKLLTLWKIPTHSLKVLNCTKKTPLNFSSNSNNSGVVTHTPAPKSRDCVRSLAATRRQTERIEFPARTGSCQSSRAELTMLWGFESWLKCLQLRMSPGAGGTVAEVLPCHKNANVHSPIWILV